MFALPNSSAGPLQTPPGRRARHSSKRDRDSDAASVKSRSSADSGVFDLSPRSATKSRPLGQDVVEVDEKADDKDGPPTDAEDSTAEHGEPIPENPIDSRYNILLRQVNPATDARRRSSTNSQKLVIVGGQSSGKSSLLQSLTGIPFPVDTACCTRFPTRIVSKRTAPDSEESFSITIDNADVEVPEMPKASQGYQKCKITGKSLTKAKFVEILEEISTKHIGIRKGTGPNTKNFVAEVVRVELHGPKRSDFKILDLPGIFDNSGKVNKQDPGLVEKMIIQYMEQPDNIIICVADAPTHPDRQKICKLANQHVREPKRRIGVFTKCDMVNDEPDAAKEIVATAKGAAMHKVLDVLDGWFLVRNRASKDPDSFDLDAVERSLFSTPPWNSVDDKRCGSSSLKAALGDRLSTELWACFPQIKAKIEMQLVEKKMQKISYGEARDTREKRRQFVSSVVQQYEQRAKMALQRPTSMQTLATELRRVVNELNQKFDEVMHAMGATWEFEDLDVNPRMKMKELIQTEAGIQVQPSAQHKRRPSDYPDVFAPYSEVGNSSELMQTIEKTIIRFQGADPPGVSNPAIYPIIYRLQVKKWTPITEVHVYQVQQAVVQCVQAILQETCPPVGATNLMYKRLFDILSGIHTSSCEAARLSCEAACRRETERELLQVTDSRFGEDVLAWQKLRLWKAIVPAQPWAQGLGVAEFDNLFDRANPSLPKNMANQVHDVLKVFYKSSITSFIKTITDSVIEDFISDEKSTLKAVSMKWLLGLSDQEIDALGGEDEAIVRGRRDVQAEIDRLEKDMAIVNEAEARMDALGGK
ncbi:hypothetical protein ACJ41O_010687 [Fusarium nematophilum]